ncbi:hypothetical protein PLESTM_001432700 [Pleodorina starrii]|nr:hypothetical protein PLESTM_001432700 [Pleodorina starrii]
MALSGPAVGPPTNSGGIEGGECMNCGHCGVTSGNGHNCGPGASPAAANAAAAAGNNPGAAAAAVPPSPLYRSRMQQVTVAFKFEIPPGMSIERAAEILTAAARPAVEAVMNGRVPPPEDAGAPAAVSAPPPQRPAAGAVPAAAGRRRFPSGRWLSRMTEVQCLRGCVELVLRLQYIGDELDDVVLTVALEVLKRELAGQLEAAAAGAVGPATEGASGTAAAPEAPSAAAAAAAAPVLQAPAGAAAGGAAGGDEVDDDDEHDCPGVAGPRAEGSPGGSGGPDMLTRQQQPHWSEMWPSSCPTAPSTVVSTLATADPVPAPDAGGGSVRGGEESSSGAGAGAVSEPAARAVQLIALLETPVVGLGAGGGGSGGGSNEGGVLGDAGGRTEGAGVAALGVLPGGSGVVPDSSPRATWQLHLFLDGGGGGGGHRHVAGGGGGAGGSAAAGGSPSVEVRVVVKQHGSVVAEVERLTVGYPRGASVRLDLSGLTEGDAALLVLPYIHPAAPPPPPPPPPQQPQAEAPPQGPAPAGSAEPGPGPLATLPHVGPLYLPIAVVPPGVAEELCGLMDKMEREFAERTDTLQQQQQQQQQHRQQHPTDPRVIRARAFTHHFSVLVSDIVSLLLGCDRVTGEAEEEGPEVEAGGVVVRLRQVCGDVLSFLVAMRLTATVRYVLQEIQAAGGANLLRELISGTEMEEGALGRVLSGRGPTGGEEELGHEEEEAEAQPRGAGADKDMAAAGSETGGRSDSAAAETEGVAIGGGAGSGKGGCGGDSGGVFSGSEDPAGRLERFLRRGATPRHQRRVTALRAMLLGFSEPDMEEACTAFRCHHAQPWDLPVAVLNAVLAAVLVAFTIGVGYGGGSGEAVPWGPRGGGGFLSRIWAPLPPWALVQLALCCGCLLLPPLLLEVWDGLCKPRGRSPEEGRRRLRPAERLREPLLRAGHAVSLILLFAYVKWNGGPGEKMQLLRTGSALAALMVVMQPVFHSIHVRGNVGNWVVAAVMLALLFRATADGDVATVASADTAPSSLSNIWTAWLPSAASAASLVLASVLLVAVRDVGWRMDFLEHGGREVERRVKAD